MLKVPKNGEEAGETHKELKPEYIRDMLFYFHDSAHKFHQNTTGGFEHDAMGKLYEGLIEFKDDIPEKIMGYLGGIRLSGLEKIELAKYKNKEDSIRLCKELLDFSYNVYEWAEDKKFCDIENLSQSLSGLAAKTIYRLSFV